MDQLPQRRHAARRRGRYRGIGISNYIEVTTGAPREYTKITVFADRRIEVAIGTQSSGQGHETSFAQLVTEWLGVPLPCIRLVTGDTDIVPVGGGSHSGRSMRIAGIVIGKAADDIIRRGRSIAADMLEAAEPDIDFVAGEFAVKGTDRSIGLFDVAAAAPGALSAVCDETVAVAGFPYGCHVCEVEVDPETGAVAIERYAAVDDVGRAINPLILHGQTHGGLTQGVGQALYEHCFYDTVSGELLSASLSDYGIPRADDLPSFETEISEVPSPTIRSASEPGEREAPRLRWPSSSTPSSTR